MPKYGVYASVGATMYLGEYEAETEDEAIEMAMKNASTPTLCHQCSGELDIGDIIDFEADLINSPASS